jgi:Uncharacterised nucleotidyltransferase
VSTDAPLQSGWQRVADAIEQVRDRLLRATAALEAGQVPYAVIGGNAVAEWVGSVDQAAVRFTKDVDILLRREDLEGAKAVMASAGFIYRHAASIDMFLDGPGAKARDAVHVIFAGEKVTPKDLVAAPTVEERTSVDKFHVVNFDALVRMKLTSYRRKDQVHLQDMIDVGLLDATWPARLPKELGDRLQAILDTPEG